MTNMIKHAFCLIFALAACSSFSQVRERGLAPLFAEETAQESTNSNKGVGSSGLPATVAPSQKSDRPSASPKVINPAPAPGWFWVNAHLTDRPGCVPLDEEPLSSLAGHFGSAPMRVVQDARHQEGRIMTVEVQARSGPEAFVFATTESICNRIRAAALDAKKDIQSSRNKGPQYFHLEPADVARLRVKDPTLFCAGEICTTRFDDFIRFQGNVLCQSDYSFSTDKARPSAGCSLTPADAQRVISTLRSGLGTPAISERSVPPTRSTHYVWQDGPLKVELMQVKGGNINGTPVSNWSIYVSRR